MEKLFHARWWDYSGRKFNINGRICLETMIPFGILGCLIMYFSNPFLMQIIEKIPPLIMHIVVGILATVFLVDNIISLKVIANVRMTTTKVTKDNTEEITKKVKEILLKRSILHRRLLHAFPRLETWKRKKQE